MEYVKKRLCDLRDYAREIGVRAPTTYTKEQLIIKIQEVESGKQKPYFTKTAKVKKKEREREITLYVVERVKSLLEEIEKELKERQ